MARWSSQAAETGNPHLASTAPVGACVQDNVFVNVVISVQYQVAKEFVYDAFYRLTDPRSQVRGCRQQLCWQQPLS